MATTNRRTGRETKAKRILSSSWGEILCRWCSHLPRAQPSILAACTVEPRVKHWKMENVVSNASQCVSSLGVRPKSGEAGVRYLVHLNPVLQQGNRVNINAIRTAVINEADVQLARFRHISCHVIVGRRRRSRIRGAPGPHLCVRLAIVIEPHRIEPLLIDDQA